MVSGSRSARLSTHRSNATPEPVRVISRDRREHRRNGPLSVHFGGAQGTPLLPQCVLVGRALRGVEHSCRQSRRLARSAIPSGQRKPRAMIYRHEAIGSASSVPTVGSPQFSGSTQMTTRKHRRWPERPSRGACKCRASSCGAAPAVWRVGQALRRSMGAMGAAVREEVERRLRTFRGPRSTGRCEASHDGCQSGASK